MTSQDTPASPAAPQAAPQATGLAACPKFNDPLPAEWPLDLPEFLISTTSSRACDEELRPLGYEVYWQPQQGEGGIPCNAFYARKAAPRKPAKVFIARLPYGNQEAPSVGDWLFQTVLQLEKDPRVADYRICHIDDTPTSMVRNMMARQALEWGADILLFVDADMQPDYLVGKDGHTNAKAFFPVAFEHWWNHPGPCMVAAPYCCGGVSEDPLVFRWSSLTSPPAPADLRITRFSREETDTLTGMGRASALPTGLLLVDTRIFQMLPRPWFYYEYTDDTYSEKASTEDITFTRDACLHGVPLFCAWDCWAGHWKRKLVGKPSLANALAVPPHFRNAVFRNLHREDRVNPSPTQV